MSTQTRVMNYDPAYGTPVPFPPHAVDYREFHGEIAWLYNPWTGAKRDPRDIGSDVLGHLIVDVSFVCVR